MQFLSPKSFGTRIQDRIIEKNQFKKTNPSDDLGDFTLNNLHCEFKTTLLTTSNKLANFVGIRPYQKIDGYFLIVVDTNSIPYKTLQFQLTKKQMSNELEILKANPSNGTKASNERNESISYRFSLDLLSDNVNSKRWEKYKIEFLLL